VYNANYRLGAGVRCIEWVSSNVFIAAGFDNQFKEFDLRTGLCHYTFNDPFANDYCSLAVSVDHNNISNGILLGGNHHSTVRLVNRKQRQIQKVYFVSKQASPVHSLAATSEYLFASVDRSIVALDFTKSDPYFERIRYRF
jgi:WD40 repeat protein